MTSLSRDREVLQQRLGVEITFSEFMGLTDFFDVTVTHPETMRDWLKVYRLGFENGYREGINDV